ncbi:MAG: glycosyltransferase family 39 protein [Candidatus Omnitrophica bacterium]|nr:glycosyltransferase family 39 protein [Candidatus Omnitrophota bacterium]
MDNLNIENKENKTLHLWCWLVFFIYIGLRGLAWSVTVLLEDPDSIYLMYDIKTFMTFNLSKIIALRADATPLYPFFSALCSLPGWSVEFGARLSSMVFSALLFFFVFLIGNRFAKKYAVLFGLLILSFNPTLIPLSYSILTESSYIAICYLGLWLFLVQYRNPKLWQSALLGIVFGLSFLSRTEGLLYIAIIPFIQVTCYLLFNRKDYGVKKLIGSVLLYVLFFSIMAGPQIWRVSQRIGRFAINGRQVWTLILKNNDQKSYHEKILGLDYSSKRINLGYVQSHPEAIDELSAKTEIKSFVKNSLHEFDTLYQKNLGILIGPLGIIFFALGLLALFQGGCRSECFIFLAFIASALVAPLIHNVTIRHIAVIAPLIMLIEGVGIAYLTNVITEDKAPRHYGQVLVPAVSLCAVIGAFCMPLKTIYLDQPKYNFDYNPATVKRLAGHLNQYAREASMEAPKIVSRKGNLAFYAKMEGFPIPYTTYEKFIRYCGLNEIDFMFFEHRLLKKYPFYQEWISREQKEGLTLLYREIDDFNKPIELFYFDKTKLRGNRNEQIQ